VVGEVKCIDSRAGGVGGRAIAAIRSQFHKLHWKTPRGNKRYKVMLTDGPVPARKRACKERASRAGGVGGRTIATSCVSSSSSHTSR